MRLFFSGLWLLLGLFPGAAADAATAESERARLDQVRQQIRALNQRLNQDRSARDDLRRRLEDTERRIADINRSLRRTREMLAANEAERQRLQSRLEVLYAEQQRQRAELGRLVYSAYVTGQRGFLKMLLSQDDPASVGRLSVYYRYLTQDRVQQIERIRASVERTTELEAAAEREAERSQELAEQQRRQSQDLKAQRDQRTRLLARVEQQISSRQAELSRLKRDEERLQKLVSELRQYLLDLPADRGSFRDMRGKLPLPVKAAIKARFGQPKSEGGLRWQGLLLAAPEGSAVRAVYQGRVAFADWLRGFGLLLIIDHGDGYMSLYSHNQALVKEVGDWVQTGEVIARVGDSGGLGTPGLYFEIRHNGKPRNPLRWCKAR